MPLPGCRRPGALFGPLAPRLRLRTVPGRGLAPFPGGGPNGASPRPRRWPPPPPLARITCPSLLPSGVFAPGLVRRRSPRAALASGVVGAGERRRVRPGSHQGGKASRAACVGWWLPSCRRHPCPVGRRVRASLHQERSLGLGSPKARHCLGTASAPSSHCLPPTPGSSTRLPPCWPPPSPLAPWPLCAPCARSPPAPRASACGSRRTTSEQRGGAWGARSVFGRVVACVGSPPPTFPWGILPATAPAGAGVRVWGRWRPSLGRRPARTGPAPPGRRRRRPAGPARPSIAPPGAMTWAEPYVGGDRQGQGGRGARCCFVGGGVGGGGAARTSLLAARAVVFARACLLLRACTRRAPECDT